MIVLPVRGTSTLTGLTCFSGSTGLSVSTRIRSSSFKSSLEDTKSFSITY